MNNKEIQLRPLIIYFIFSLLLILIGIRTHNANKLTIQIGEIATQDIRATKTIIDEDATEKLKLDAENSIVPKYRISPLIQMRVNDSVEEFMDYVRDIKARDDLGDYHKALELEEISNLNLDSGLHPIPIAMTYRDISSYESLLTDLLSQTMGQGIREEELEYEKNSLVQVINDLEYSEDVKAFGIAIIEDLFRPNEFVDEVETQRQKDNAVASIQDVVINPNDIIVAQGNTITPNDYHLMSESDLLEGEDTSYSWHFGFITMILTSVFLFALYIHKFNYNILNDNRIIASLLIILLTIVISLVSNMFSGYLMPISLSAILIAILIDVKLAMIANLLVAGFLSLILRLDPTLIFVLIISSNLVILLDFKINQRYSVLIIGTLIGITNFIVLGAFNLINPSETLDFLKSGGLLFLNGLIVGVIALGTLPLWENIFSIITPLKLLELTNPNQPLLKRLLLEAPGTYHHSIMVGNLSEAAANSIGADSYLAKAGAIYHDIGKVVNPYYFKENQFDIANPHDQLGPRESAKIITSHTDMGKKLARGKRIPKEIINIIEQHHGDTSVQYFYHKAKQEDDSIHIDEFRYKGKKPQSKEAAIVMLADSTEAAVRSLTNPTKEQIGDMIEKIVNGKVKDGQLEECDITYRDIKIIIETFKSTLIAVSHDRIKYPIMEEGQI